MQNMQIAKICKKQSTPVSVVTLAMFLEESCIRLKNVSKIPQNVCHLRLGLCLSSCLKVMKL